MSAAARRDPHPDFGPWRHPSLWRVVVAAQIAALGVNTLLWWLVEGDTFAEVIAIASGGLAVALLVSRYFAPTVLDDLLLGAFVVWTANLIEFATTDGIRWQSQVRQCGFYGALGLMALGAYIARRTVPTARRSAAPE